jgi:hypothetical protein
MSDFIRRGVTYQCGIGSPGRFRLMGGAVRIIAVAGVKYASGRIAITGKSYRENRLQGIAKDEGE